MNTAYQPNSIILAANPSHGTVEEHMFWEGFALHAKRRGWCLFEVATRALPHTEGAVCISLPARLGDLNHRPVRTTPVRDSRITNPGRLATQHGVSW